MTGMTSERVTSRGLGGSELAGVELAGGMGTARIVTSTLRGPGSPPRVERAKVFDKEADGASVPRGSDSMTDVVDCESTSMVSSVQKGQSCSRRELERNSREPSSPGWRKMTRKSSTSTSSSFRTSTFTGSRSSR